MGKASPRASKGGLEKRTLVNQVYDYLRDCIVNLSLRPGERIDVKGLAQELSVSQTPIREAINKLVEQGLIEAKPYRGYFVVQLSQRDIQELFDLRKSLETLALRYVYENVDGEKLKELLKRLDDLEQRGFPVKDTQKFDEDFHLGFLIRGSGNRWLEKFANGVMDLIKLTTRLSMNPRAACEEHREILIALNRHDLEKAVAALEGHLERSKSDAMVIPPEKGGVRIKERSCKAAKKICRQIQ